MSIVAYTGLPGSGKSYSVVEHQILPALQAGRLVVTNLAMLPDQVAALNLPGELQVFSLDTLIGEPGRLYDFVKPGCVFVVDEVWKIWPQGMNADKVPEEYKRLLAEHRHMVDAQNNSTQIVLVVQDLANIAAFARRLVENTFVSHKLGYIGLNKSYRVDIYYGGVTGCTPNVNKRLRFVAGRYKKEVYALYKSQTMSESAGGHGDESKIDGRANILKRPVVIFGAVFAVVAMCWGVWRFNQAFHDMADPSKGVVGLRGKHAAQADAQRSGASPVSQQAAGLSRGPVPMSPRLIMMISGFGAAQISGIIATADRNYEVSGADCAGDRSFKVVRYRCRWRSVWYDEAGAIPSPNGAP